jgi:hypothetical protein
MEGNAVERNAVRVLLLLDFDAVRIVGADFMQRNDVRGNQAEQHHRHRDDMEGEETVQGGVADDEVAAQPERQVRPDQRNRGEQIHDHLGTPVGHLTPGQQIAKEGFSHQTQEDDHAEDPDQFAWLAVGTVEHAAEHVHVYDDEEGRGTGRMHVADQPAPGHVAHDVLDAGECNRNARRVQRCIRLEVHGQQDAGDDLNGQHQHRQGAEEIPEVEVLRCVVFGQVCFPVGGERKALVDPVQRPLQHGVNFAHRIRPSCLRQSQAWRRQDTCAVGFRGCPGPACSCRLDRRGRTWNHGRDKRNRPPSRHRCRIRHRS